MNKLKKKIIDTYLCSPIFFDCLISITVWIGSKHLHYFEFYLNDRNNQISILSNIINTDVSLAGFVLAALTIIVAFKSNLQAKGIEESKNALELIFSSKHYNNIVFVFVRSLIEFIICFVFIFFVWISADNLSIHTINRVNITGILLTTLAIIRSLWVLIIILDLENYKND
jgi:hypothetical protein